MVMSSEFVASLSVMTSSEVQDHPTHKHHQHTPLNTHLSLFNVVLVVRVFANAMADLSLIAQSRKLHVVREVDDTNGPMHNALSSSMPCHRRAANAQKKQSHLHT